MITVKFCRDCDIRKLEVFELDSYKAFFDFYVAHYNKGIIFGVKEETENGL